MCGASGKPFVIILDYIFLEEGGIKHTVSHLLGKIPVRAEGDRVLRDKLIPKCRKVQRKEVTLGENVLHCNAILRKSLPRTSKSVSESCQHRNSTFPRL